MTVFLIILYMYSCGSPPNMGVNNPHESHDSHNSITKRFKIVGYYPIGAAIGRKKTNIRFNLLTHINLSFINPDSSGSFTKDFLKLKPFIKEAHQDSVKVLLSLGGGNKDYFSTWINKTHRKKFIGKLIKLVKKTNVDGIDVDLEGDFVYESDYGLFVKQLCSALHAKDKLCSAALHVAPPSSVLTHNFLMHLNYINIMAYDKTGPWYPGLRESHSPYSYAVAGLKNYGTKKHIPNPKLILGVPFYGYAFGPDSTWPVKTMHYKEIINKYPDASLVSRWNLGNGYTVFYNGIPLIKAKTALAKKKAGGIMIWSLPFDVHGNKSLLRAINKVTYSN